MWCDERRGSLLCLHQACWSEAYFDEGGANRPIITYSVPIRQDGVFVGVATMDVALDPGSTLGMAQPAAYEDVQGVGESAVDTSASLCPLSFV